MFLTTFFSSFLYFRALALLCLLFTKLAILENIVDGQDLAHDPILPWEVALGTQNGQEREGAPHTPPGDMLIPPPPLITPLLWVKPLWPKT